MTDHELRLKAVALRRAMLQLIVNARAGRLGGDLAEAFGNYFGWDVYRHEQQTKTQS